MDHPELAPRLSGAPHFNFDNQTTNAAPTGGDLSDPNRSIWAHGTSVAGLIAGAGDFQGMAPGAKIYHARAFEGGHSTMDVILAALDWAADQEVRIINMSFVGPKNDFLEEACAAARGRDIVLVAAAGNKRSSVGLTLHAPTDRS